MTEQYFKTSFAEEIFNLKYRHHPNETWADRAKTIVDAVCGTEGGKSAPLLCKSDLRQLEHYITKMLFIPAGRYIYYAGRLAKFYNNCYAFIAEEDTREEWGRILHRVSDALMTGGGITVEYSKFRARGEILKSTGGVACLPGDTVVYKDRKKSREQNVITLQQLWDWKVSRPNQLRSQPVYLRSLDELNGEFFRNKLVDVIDNGIAPIFKIKTKSGYVIKATANHRFYAQNGIWKELGKFKPGEFIGVNGSQLKTCINCGKPINRKAKLWCLACHNKNQKKDTALDTTARQRKACSSYRKTYCENCGIKNTRFETHHIDHNPYNNSHTNLLNLCCSCHRYAHVRHDYRGDGYKHKYLDFDLITEIMYIGEERVYDLVMEGPNHNFIANGFVSHNSGPIPLMYSINEVARNVQQGGSRRSAAGATLHWKHRDIDEFIHTKDWPYDIQQLKAKDFNFPAPLDMTNSSVRWDTEFHRNYSATGILPKVWYNSVTQACRSGEPGHYYNFYDQAREIARNVCGEFISDEDSDCCNLGSVNFANIKSKAELQDVVNLASKFLLCGTVRSQLPNDKIHAVRNRTRKIGLGPMGMHEWLLQRSMSYSCTHELHQWLSIYQAESERSANELADTLSIPRPKRYRAAAPAGSIGAMAATTTGIEPLFSVAYKRRYLKNGTKWVYQYVIDPIAKLLMEKYGFDPDKIETAASLAKTPIKRILFQTEVQKYVDMGISSTINLPEWGTQYNNETTAETLALTLATMCDSLRGITMYPENARGGQPLTPMPYREAINYEGKVFYETPETCRGGGCGI